MIRDENLKRVLDQWEAPKPTGKLDKRVRASWKQSHPKRVSWKLWGAIAVGMVLVAAATLLSRGPAPAYAPTAEPRFETRMASAGFRPMPEAAVTVVKAGTQP